MSSSMETGRPEPGNGDVTSDVAMVREEELAGLPRDAMPDQGTGTKVAYGLMTN